jgi:hypothetical protein
VKVRYADFHTITRSRTLLPTSSELELYPGGAGRTLIDRGSRD